MKYQPSHYAKAFSRAVTEHPQSAEKFVKNFARLIEKNGDAHMAPKILAETERALRATTGLRHVVITTARPLPRPAHTTFAKFLHPHDTIEEKTDPSLIAGVKITVNDELEFDGTLRRKLDRLFVN